MNIKVPLGKDKEAVTAVVSKAVKKQIKLLADMKRWSMSQTAAVLIEEGLKHSESLDDSNREDGE